MIACHLSFGLFMILVKKYPSVIPLVLANLIPLAGVLFLKWDLFYLLLVYWFESAVIGFYNILKMIVIGRWLAIPLVLFFMVHYGGFMYGHMLFLVSFFGPKGVASFRFPLVVFRDYFFDVAIAVIFLLLSHGFSFFYYFLGKREYLSSSLEKQMRAPYQRIILMHLTVIFGGWAVMIFGAPIGALVIMVFLKIAIDLKAHLREHSS